MTVTRHRARVVWEATKQDLRAHTVHLAEQAVPSSCSAEWGGDAAKADPEELFVAALSSCHMLWFLDHSRRQRLRVTSYQDEPEGTMDGTRFTHVALRPRIEFEGEVAAETVADLHHRAHSACFIASTVNCPVEVEAP